MNFEKTCRIPVPEHTNADRNPPQVVAQTAILAALENWSCPGVRAVQALPGDGLLAASPILRSPYRLSDGFIP
jgi:hypothetical protein